MITSKQINTSVEKRIVAGMIVSQEFAMEIHHIVNFDYFQNSYLRRVAKWVLEYFDKYEKVPFHHIQDLYDIHKRKLKESEADLIKELLHDISERYSHQKINAKYLLDQAVTYFQGQELEIRANNIQACLLNNDVPGAQDQITEYIQVEKQSSDGLSATGTNSVEGVFEKSKEFFSFGGQLGKFLGEMQRGWLVGLTGPFKRGKTFWLMEFGYIGMVSDLKVVLFSLEMSKRDVLDRWYKRITGTGNPDHTYFPIFDCLKNQSGECMKPERKNQLKLLDSDGNKPNFSPRSQYRICTWCRKNDPEFYEKATWFKDVGPLPEYTQQYVEEKLAPFDKVYNNKFMFFTYPRFSANVRDIVRDLDKLERTHNFIPDVIIVDYADILKPEKKEAVGVEKEDETWMSLARLAGERNCLVVTGTQATRQGLDVKTVTHKHTARWIGKLGHVDMMLTLNQTPEEKVEGAMRIGIMEHRHAFFVEGLDVAVLQKFGTGQVHLDSQI